RLLEGSRSETAQVRVFNPDYEKHGWQSSHSAVEILHPDMPFLVDSARMELARRGRSIHTLQNTVFSVRRNAAGELLELLPKGSTGEGVHAEALMFLEIDRCATASELHELQQALLDVLDEVRLAVSDFPAMQARAREAITRLEHCPVE